MEQKRFNTKFIEISKKYRAECYSNNRHWKGVWRESYTDACNDGDKHRYGNNGNNQFHDINIIELTHSAGKLVDKNI